MHKILKAQKEAESASAESPKMAKTGDAGQIVFEAATESAQPKTADAAGTPEPDSESEEDTALPLSAQETGSSGAVKVEAGETARPKDEL